MASDIENYFHRFTNKILDLIENGSRDGGYIDFWEGKKLFYIGYGDPTPKGSSKQSRITQILVIVELRPERILVTLKSKKFPGIRSVIAYINEEKMKNKYSIEINC